MKKLKNIIAICVVVWVVLCVCGYARAECSGSVIVDTPESYAAADLIECIAGDLTIHQNYGIADLRFHNLKSVSGSIFVIGRHPPFDWELRFVRLETVGGMIHIESNQHLTEFLLGGWIYSAGGVKIFNNPHLQKARLGWLQYVDSDLIISRNNSMVQVNAFYLVAVDDGLYIEDNPLYLTCSAFDILDKIEVDEWVIEDNMEDECSL